MKIKGIMSFDDCDATTLVTKSYKLTDKVKLNGVEYEVFMIADTGILKHYHCRRVITSTPT